MKCFMLYSIQDMLNFLSFPEKHLAVIFSMSLDGQKVFIVRFSLSEVVSRFMTHSSSASPTLIGCVDYNIELVTEDLGAIAKFIGGCHV